MTRSERFVAEHAELSRRYFLRLGVAGVMATGAANAAVAQLQKEAEKTKPSETPDKSGASPDPYFTDPKEFRDVSRGKPIPHTLSEEQRREVGLTRETWSLDVLSDPDHPSKLGKSYSKAEGTALRFETLIQLGEKHAVRFPKVMTCLNLGCPLGMGLWEGVPLRDVIWLTQPREDLRRVFYYGFHNADPQQMFRSSLPIGRVLEDPIGLPPVILCYKLNGEWLDPQRGGPVRMVVPEAYGFKSVKWLSHLFLTNLAHANDTYAEHNNDIDSSLKTFAATLSFPRFVKTGEPILVSGYAQVGISGLSKVQVSIESRDAPDPATEPDFAQADWIDADLLEPPKQWSTLNAGKIPASTHGFDSQGVPLSWPMRLTNAHWAMRLDGLPKGEYTLRCRTIDEQGNAQPMPRPFRKSGHAAIESVELTVTE